VTVRNMRSSEQYRIRRADAIDRLQRAMKGE
jgi:hypothetical protein